VWWLCTSSLFIDASTPEGYEEEEYYPEAEEEGLDQYPNQGKLWSMQAFVAYKLYRPKFYFTFVLAKLFL